MRRRVPLLRKRQGGFPVAPLDPFGRKKYQGGFPVAPLNPFGRKKYQGGFPIAPLELSLRPKSPEASGKPLVGPQAETLRFSLRFYAKKGSASAEAARGLSGRPLEPLRGLLFSRNVQRKKVAFMDRGGRYSRHYETPETRPPRAGLLPRIRGWMLRRGEGRKRITPGEPNTALGAGWQEAKHR